MEKVSHKKVESHLQPLAGREAFECKFKETIKGITPYESEEEYLQDLQRVLEKDYGTMLEGEKLKEAGKNLDRVFSSFL